MRKKIIIFILGFLLIINIVLSNNFTLAIADTNNSSYQASTNYSSIQGQDGWYYVEKTDSGYVNMNWDSVNNYWKGSYEYSIISANIQHPDVSDSVRKWVAPISGNIIITSNGNIRKWDTSGGDGVVVKLIKNNIEIWSRYIDATDGIGVSFPAKSIEVNAGDSIYFLVNKYENNYCDSTIWDPIIEYKSYNYQASTNYSSIQGQDGWYYVEKTDNGYVNMNWDSVNNYWKGSYEYSIIVANIQHPDVSDSVRKWVAPISGNIIITSNGNIRKWDTSGGDGVFVKLYKNDIEIWSKYIDATDGIGVSFPARSIEVNAGDIIYFVVNKNGNNYCDSTIWDPIIEYKSYNYQASTDCSSSQGQDGWYYVEKTDNGYVNMNWDSVNNCWKGSYEYSRIVANIQHPDVSDSVRKWVAPISGNIIITSNGNIRKWDTSGVVLSDTLQSPPTANYFHQIPA